MKKKKNYAAIIRHWIAGFVISLFFHRVVWLNQQARTFNSTDDPLNTIVSFALLRLWPVCSVCTYIRARSPYEFPPPQQFCSSSSFFSRYFRQFGTHFWQFAQTHLQITCGRSRAHVCVCVRCRLAAAAAISRDVWMGNKRQNRVSNDEIMPLFSQPNKWMEWVEQRKYFSIFLPRTTQHENKRKKKNTCVNGPRYGVAYTLDGRNLHARKKKTNLV